MRKVTYIFDDNENITSIRVEGYTFRNTPSGTYVTNDRHMQLVNPMNPKEIMIVETAGVLRRSGRYPWKRTLQESLVSLQPDPDEEVAKAFQLGMSFGFIDGLNANKNDISLDELKRIYIGMDGKAVQVYPNNDVLDNLRAEIEDYITHSPYINGCTNCCRLRDDVLRIIDKYKVESEVKE